MVAFAPYFEALYKRRNWFLPLVNDNPCKFAWGSPHRDGLHFALGYWRYTSQFDDVLDVGPTGYGLLSASIELGAISMSVALILLPQVDRAGRAMFQLGWLDRPRTGPSSCDANRCWFASRDRRLAPNG